MMLMHKNTIQINFVQVPTLIKEFVSKMPDTTSFIRRHGSLLRLVTSSPNEDMVKVLFQFINPLHHCFTFLDYQLVLTMEEFSQLLGVPIIN